MKEFFPDGTGTNRYSVPSHPCGASAHPRRPPSRCRWSSLVVPRNPSPPLIPPDYGMTIKNKKMLKWFCVQAAASIEHFKEQTSHKLRGVVCPDHRQPPRLKFQGGTLQSVSIQLSGCCDKLLSIANRAIAGL